MNQSLKKAILVAFILFYFVVGSVSAQDVLRINEDRSHVIDMYTGGKIPYSEFIDTEQLEGHDLEFHIVIDKTGNPVPDDYVLELRTNLEDPEWRYGDAIHTSATAIVWEGADAHLYAPPTVILSGTVPKAITNVKDPGFESIDLVGIGKETVYVTLTVGTSGTGATLKKVIEKLIPTMEFFSTSKDLIDAGEELEENLGDAREIIGEEDIEDSLKSLYEEGHPGWALLLSEDYKRLADNIAPPPVFLYVILSVLLGLIVGGGFMYAFMRKEEPIDLMVISTELEEVSTKIDDTSRSINSVASKLARTDDSEQRDSARELMKMRGSLNESSSQIRSVANRVREE